MTHLHTHLHRDFTGAKMALFVGASLLVLQRDDRPELLWPGHWDLPGGGREGVETPVETVLRETHEEFGLRVPRAHIHWARAATNSIGRTVWFFVGHMPGAAARDVRFGDEGQGWALMTPETFRAHPKAVPQFQRRLGEYLRGVSPDPWVGE